MLSDFFLSHVQLYSKQSIEEILIFVSYIYPNLNNK